MADDITLAPVDMEGVPGEWSMAPGCNADRVLVFFHGGGYCAGSIRSHRRMVTEAGRAGAVRTLAVGYRLAPEHPFPAALMDALTAWHFVRGQGFPARTIAGVGRRAPRLRLAGIALDRPHDVRRHADNQRSGRSADSLGLP